MIKKYRALRIVGMVYKVIGTIILIDIEENTRMTASLLKKD
jgi:hypothetical protein